MELDEQAGAAAAVTPGGEARQVTGTAAPAEGAGAATREQFSPVRRIIVRFTGEAEDVQAARAAFISCAVFIRQTFQWVVADNLTPAGRAARRAASYDYKRLLDGGMRPKWRNGAQIFVLPPGSRVPRQYTEEDVKRCPEAPPETGGRGVRGGGAWRGMAGSGEGPGRNGDLGGARNGDARI